MSGTPTERMTLFDFVDAVPLGDTDMMSMPTLTDPSVVPDTFMSWAGSSGHLVKVLYRGDGDDGMSLVWSWFGPALRAPPPQSQRRLPVLRGQG